MKKNKKQNKVGKVFGVIFREEQKEEVAFD